MGDYFTLSQQIKSEIEQNSELMKALKDHMSGESKLEMIGGGTAHNHYGLGQLESGLWVAVREYRVQPYLRASVPVLSAYESYALTAESYSEMGRVVPQFSVGVFRGPNAVLLVEDLTQDGARKLIHDNDNKFGHFSDEPDTKVYVDLEQDHVEYDTFRFMNRTASIDLT